MTRPVQHLYFIATEDGAAVKIGVTNNVSWRLRDLQAGNHTVLQVELELRFAQAGTARRYEDALHQQFAEFWRHREWFTYAPPIRAYVAAWHAGETPVTTWPRFSCSQGCDDIGNRLERDAYLTHLRAKARGRA